MQMILNFFSPSILATLTQVSPAPRLLYNWFPPRFPPPPISSYFPPRLGYLLPYNHVIFAPLRRYGISSWIQLLYLFLYRRYRGITCKLPLPAYRSRPTRLISATHYQKGVLLPMSWCVTICLKSDTLPSIPASRQIFRSMFLNTTLKHFYFVDTDTSTTVAH